MTAPTPVTIVKPEPAAAKPKPRARIAARAASWEPDPRWSHPLAAAGWVYVGGYIPHLGVPAVVMLLAAPALAVVGVFRARRRYPAVDYGEGIPLGMSWLSGAAAVAAGAWMTWAGMSSPLRAAGWLLLALVLLGAWYAVLYTGAPRAAAEVDRVEAVQEAQRVAVEWSDLFARAGLHLQVIRSEPTRAGTVLAVKGADEEKPVSLQQLRDKIPDLTVKAAASLGKTGVVVRDGDIRVEGTEAAHIHLVHICTKHVLGQTIPYEPIAEPTTIVDPLDIALYEAGAEVLLMLDGKQASHGLVIGCTGSGKTTQANVIVGRVGECVDAIVGVLASDKLVPFVYPWIKPWLQGKAERPGIDFVAGQDPARVLGMLAELYRIMRDRNAKLSNAPIHIATTDEPAIVVLIEETGDLAKRPDSIVTCDNQTMTFSRLMLEFSRAGRSALVHVFMLNTSHLHDAFGAYGAEIDRNTPFRICLKTMSHYDGRSTLPGLPGNIDTTLLRDFSQLVQPTTEQPSVLPAKAYHLEGDDIHAVAIRNASWRPEPAWNSAVWRGRWDAERLPELVEAARRDGLAWKGGGMDPIDVELNRMIEMETQRVNPEPAAPAVAASADLPDADAGIAALDAATARLGQARPLPEPLAAVMEILEGDGAPTEWVLTRELAVRLGRVARDADEDEQRKAAQTLGRQLSANHPDIRSEVRDRASGYDVRALRRAAAKIARGEA